MGEDIDCQMRSLTANKAFWKTCVENPANFVKVEIPMYERTPSPLMLNGGTGLAVRSSTARRRFTTGNRSVLESHSFKSASSTTGLSPLERLADSKDALQSNLSINSMDNQFRTSILQPIMGSSNSVIPGSSTAINIIQPNSTIPHFSIKVSTVAETEPDEKIPRRRTER